MATTYPLPLPSLTLTIGGTAREVMSGTLRIHQILGAQVDTCSFSTKAPETWRPSSDPGTKPTVGQEVIVTIATGSDPAIRQFGGTINRVKEVRVGTKAVRWDVECVDFTALLMRVLVNKLYVNVAISDIVIDVARNYAPQIIIDANVQTTTQVISPHIAFAYEYPLAIFDRLAGMLNWQWFVDPYKVLHFYDPTNNPSTSPNSITDTSLNFDNISIEPQLDQVRNRVVVQGGQAISQTIIESWTAAGTETTFQLAHHDVIGNLTPSGTQPFFLLNGAEQAVGLQGVQNNSTFPGGWMLDTTNGQVVPADVTTPAIADGDEATFTYQYKVPIIVEREDDASIATVAAFMGEDYDTVVLADHPVHYFKLEDAVTTTTAANAGTGGVSYSGMYVQPLDRPIDGPFVGGASHGVRFNGGTITTATGVVIDSRVQYSLEAWVQAPKTGGGGIISHYTSALGGAALYIDGSQSNNARYALRNRFVSGPATTQVLNSQTNPTGADYDHVVGIFDGQSTGARIYVNNALKNSTATFTAASMPTVLRSGLQIADYDYGSNILSPPASVARAAVYTYALSGTQVQDHYMAGKFGGVRDTVFTDNTLVSFDQARRTGDYQLTKWSNVITRIAFSSYVSGWAIGDSVPVTLTAGGSGRTFAGTALIQEIELSAIGAQRVRYDVICEASRFNLIDYQKSLSRPRDVLLGDTAIAPINLVRSSPAQQAIVIDATPIVTSATLPFLVAPDWGSGTAPYIKVGFWQIDSARW